jgi:hypothetical protein
MGHSTKDGARSLRSTSIAVSKKQRDEVTEQQQQANQLHIRKMMRANVEDMDIDSIDSEASTDDDDESFTGDDDDDYVKDDDESSSSNGFESSTSDDDSWLSGLFAEDDDNDERPCPCSLGGPSWPS